MQIAIKSSRFTSGLEPLFGHNCDTEEQMRRYCTALDPGARTFTVVSDDFDFGATVEPDDAPRDCGTLAERAKPDAVKLVVQSLKELKERLSQ